MVHSLVILGTVAVLAPLLGYLPMTSLSALLLLVAWNMSEARHFARTLRVAPKGDVAVLLTCYALTVGFDMVIGVSVGMVLAALLFMRRMADVTEAHVASEQSTGKLGRLPKGVEAYEISGPLFFGAAQKAMATLEIVKGQTQAIVLLMEDVHVMDATGLVALESALEPLKKRKCLTLLAGVRPQPFSLLRKAGVDATPHVVLCADAEEALRLAAEHVGEKPPHPPFADEA
jgi:SulP family sulfate permease